MASHKDSRTKAQRQARIASIKRANAIAEKKAVALTKLGLLPGGTKKDVHAPVSKGVSGLSGHQKYIRRKVNALFHDNKDVLQYFLKTDYTVKPKSDKSRPKLQHITTEKQIAAANRAGFKTISTPRGRFTVTNPDKKITKSGKIVTKRLGYSTRLVYLDATKIGRDERNPYLLRMLKQMEAQAKKAGKPTTIGFYMEVNDGNGMMAHILIRDNAQDMYDYLTSRYEDSVLEKVGGIVFLSYDGIEQTEKRTGARPVYKIHVKSKYVKMRDLPPSKREHRRLKARIRYAHKRAQRKKGA